MITCAGGCGKGIEGFGYPGWVFYGYADKTGAPMMKCSDCAGKAALVCGNVGERVSEKTSGIGYEIARAMTGATSSTARRWPEKLGIDRTFTIFVSGEAMQDRFLMPSDAIAISGVLVVPDQSVKAWTLEDGHLILDRRILCGSTIMVKYRASPPVGTGPVDQQTAPKAPDQSCASEDLVRIVSDALIEYGPDGHCDGAQEIADVAYEAVSAAWQKATGCRTPEEAKAFYDADQRRAALGKVADAVGVGPNVSDIIEAIASLRADAEKWRAVKGVAVGEITFVKAEFLKTLIADAEKWRTLVKVAEESAKTPGMNRVYVSPTGLGGFEVVRDEAMECALADAKKWREYERVARIAAETDKIVVGPVEVGQPVVGPQTYYDLANATLSRLRASVNPTASGEAEAHNPDGSPRSTLNGTATIARIDAKTCPLVNHLNFEEVPCGNDPHVMSYAIEQECGEARDVVAVLRQPVKRVVDICPHTMWSWPHGKRKCRKCLEAEEPREDW